MRRLKAVHQPQRFNAALQHIITRRHFRSRHFPRLVRLRGLRRTFQFSGSQCIGFKVQPPQLCDMFIAIGSQDRIRNISFKCILGNPAWLPGYAKRKGSKGRPALPLQGLPSRLRQTQLAALRKEDRLAIDGRHVSKLKGNEAPKFEHGNVES